MALASLQRTHGCAALVLAALAACGSSSSKPSDSGAGTYVGGGGGGGGGIGSGVGGLLLGPCGGVPTAGVCKDAATLTFCSVPNDFGKPTVRTVSCTGGEKCLVQGGKAACVLQAGTCRSGMSRCDGNTLQGCTNAAWTNAGTCQNGCQVSPIGAFCAAVPAAQTETLSGALTIESLQPNADRSDWATAPTRVPGRGFLVAAGFPDPAPPAGQKANFLFTDISYTDDAQATAGKYSVKVRRAADRTAKDVLAFFAVRDDGAGGISFALLNPGFGGATGQDPGASKTNAAVWSWALAVNDAGGGNVLIPLGTTAASAGSAGAAFMFDWLSTGHKHAESFYAGKRGLPLAAWFEPGTSWSCGACMFAEPVVAFGQRFDTQIVYPGDPNDAEQWAISVVDHELGHWVMQSFGTSPNEGGTHYIGIPTFPGQAWSEGWATFFSSDVRVDPFYTDKQGGTMFWVDLGNRAYPARSGGWTRPKPGDGLLQNMDENEVSAELWALSQGGAQNIPVFQGLASAHMNTPPYKRGYTRHSWDVTGPGQFANVQDSGEPAPMLADFFDAVICGGTKAAAIDAVAQPAQFYPYPSSAPLCP